MTQNLPAAARPQIVAGGQVAALIPQSLDEAFRVSQAIAASGLAPKGIDKPEQIMVAIMAGAELGLAPFQSLQSFAVVNGRPTLWGDGLLAVVRAQGVRVREWIEGDGDNMIAHCEAIRPDTGEEVARAFSVADAQKAGLWAKAGPWQQYPKRMLQMRARALALRDGCADMLRGMQIREEVEDYSHVRDVTPRQEPGLRARLEARKEAPSEGFNASQAQGQPAAEHDPSTGEIIDAEVEEQSSGDDKPADLPEGLQRGSDIKTDAQWADVLEADLKKAADAGDKAALEEIWARATGLRNRLDKSNPERLAEIEATFNDCYLAAEEAAQGGAQ